MGPELQLYKFPRRSLQKGVRQVCKIVSAERGQTVTLTCAMSAAGAFVPSMFIFPRRKLHPALMHDAPVGSVGATSQSGWTNSDVFTSWIQHFINFSGSSLNRKVLLILDNHEAHICVKVLNL
jgi:hypothetical protein